MPHFREGRPDRQVDGQCRDDGCLAPGLPAVPHVSRQRAPHSEDEVTHPDVARDREPPRRPTPADQLPQITLADVCAQHVCSGTNQKPTPPPQATFGRRNHSGEYRHIRPPLAVVEPEQARREYALWFDVQPAEVRRMAALDPPRSPASSRPLNSSGEHQNEQPRQAERSAADTASQGVAPRNLHGANLIKATPPPSGSSLHAVARLESAPHRCDREFARTMRWCVSHIKIASLKRADRVAHVISVYVFIILRAQQ